MAPGSSGFGKETVRKAPSGSACAGSTATPVEAGARERADGEPVADAVHRGVGDPQGRRVRGVQRARARGRRGRPPRPRSPRRRRGGAGRGPRRRPAAGRAIASRRGRLGDARRDRGVHRRHELGAAREVDLVAVVARRVVAGGDRDARRRAEVRDGEREERRRDGVGEEAHGDAEAVQHGRRVLGEAAGSSGGRRRPTTTPRERGSGPPRAASSRRCEPRPQVAFTTASRFMRESPASTRPRRPAVPNSSGPDMRSARSRPRRLVPALGAAHEGLELGAGLGVGVLGQERAGGGEGVAHAISPSTGGPRARGTRA